jgi:hypothetical protein
MLASLNGDAFPDVLVVLGYGDAVIDAYGDGMGGFVIAGTGPYPISAMASVSPIMARDIDQDGRDDLVAAHGTTVEVSLNLPTGWTLSWAHSAPLLQNSPGAGDFDGDGNDDLFWREALSLTGPIDLNIAYGLGNGTFAVPPVRLIPNSSFYGADVTADLDGDGKDDLVLRPQEFSNTPHQIPILWGSLPWQAPPLTLIPTSYDWLDSASVADFDRDGILDLMFQTNPLPPGANRHVVLFRGLGARQFSAPIVLWTEPVFPPIGTTRYVLDVDGDVDVDVLRSTSGQFYLTSLLLLRNETIRAPGCPGTGGVVPTCSVGLATPGNAAFAIGISQALPNSIAVLGVSLAPAAVTGCGLAIDLSPSQLILPTGPIGILATSAAGTATMTLPLPPPPALSGMAFYAQWGVLDAAGSLPASGLNFALSEGRTIYVW